MRSNVRHLFGNRFVLLFYLDTFKTTNIKKDLCVNDQFLSWAAGYHSWLISIYSFIFLQCGVSQKVNWLKLKWQNCIYINVFERGCMGWGGDWRSVAQVESATPQIRCTQTTLCLSLYINNSRVLWGVTSPSARPLRCLLLADLGSQCVLADV